MREWGFLPSPEDLGAVTAAANAFREMWASIRSPFPAAFDGTMADIRALDYMDYEGIDFPRGGIEAAALVCGEVLRRAAGLEWVVSYRGDWFVASPEGREPAIAICPLARLHEIECGGRPRGYGMHRWFIERAAFDCALGYEAEAEPAVLALIEDGGDFLGRVGRTLQQVGRSDTPGDRDRRGRR
jgi:hypothetical protein